RVTSAGRPRAEPLADGADVPEYPALAPMAPVYVEPGLPSHRRGPDGALVTTVEFADFECGYCRLSRATVRRLAPALGDRVRFSFRHYPLGAAGDSKLVAEAAVAAGAQGRFWAFHDRAFARGGRLGRADVEAIAAEIGLDLRSFRADLDDRRHFR